MRLGRIQSWNVRFPFASALAFHYLWLRLRYFASAKLQINLLLHSAYSCLWLRLRYSASAKLQINLLLHSAYSYLCTMREDRMRLGRIQSWNFVSRLFLLSPFTIFANSIYNRCVALPTPVLPLRDSRGHEAFRFVFKNSYGTTRLFYIIISTIYSGRFA